MTRSDAGFVPKGIMQSPPKGFLKNYNVFPFVDVQQVLSCLPHACLSMAVTSGHALLYGGEARHV